MTERKCKLNAPGDSKSQYGWPYSQRGGIEPMLTLLRSQPHRMTWESKNIKEDGSITARTCGNHAQTACNDLSGNQIQVLHPSTIRQTPPGVSSLSQNTTQGRPQTKAGGTTLIHLPLHRLLNIFFPSAKASCRNLITVTSILALLCRIFCRLGVRGYQELCPLRGWWQFRLLIKTSHILVRYWAVPRHNAWGWTAGQHWKETRMRRTPTKDEHKSTECLATTPFPYQPLTSKTAPYITDHKTFLEKLSKWLWLLMIGL